MSSKHAIIYFVLFTNALAGSIVASLTAGLDARNPLLWAGALYAASNVLLSMLLPGGRPRRAGTITPIRLPTDRLPPRG